MYDPAGQVHVPAGEVNFCPFRAALHSHIVRELRHVRKLYQRLESAESAVSITSNYQILSCTRAGCVYMGDYGTCILIMQFGFGQMAAWV